MAIKKNKKLFNPTTFPLYKGRCMLRQEGVGGGGDVNEFETNVIFAAAIYSAHFFFSIFHFEWRNKMC